MPSTVIRSFQYDAATQVLAIEFVSGTCYYYEQVPAAVADAFRAFREKGIYYNNEIKGKYLFTRVKGAGDQLTLF